MTRPDDEILMRYADGELDEIARARVERVLTTNPAEMARLDEYRALKARIAEYYAPVVTEGIPERLTALLTGNVVSIASASTASPARPVVRRRWVPAAIAASLAAGVLAGQLLPRAGGGPVAFEDGAMVARGDVARALDVQLASAQPADAAVRIGVSFPGRGGRACRTFETEAMAGVACRGNDRWQVMVTAPGASERVAGGYAQAGSADAVVMQAAQDMMTGEPLDAASEKRARDAGWARIVGGDAARR